MSGEILLTMNFQENAIMLNEGVLDALQRPQQVQLMVNEEEKMLLMKPCGTQSKDAFVFTPNRIMCVEIDGSALLKSLKRIAGWTSDEPRICPGIDLPEYSAVCFDLTEAFVLNPAFPNAPDRVKEEEEKTEAKVAGNMEEVSE